MSFDIFNTTLNSAKQKVGDMFLIDNTLPLIGIWVKAFLRPLCQNVLIVKYGSDFAHKLRNFR